MDVLDGNRTVFETLQEVMPQAHIGTIRNLCAAFLFKVKTRINVSRFFRVAKSRVVLATLLARPLNFLILDEPTNHLDMQSRQILLNELQKFAGTVLLVSHDRHFLHSLVDHVMEIDHGEMRLYDGDYDYYLRKSLALQK